MFKEVWCNETKKEDIAFPSLKNLLFSWGNKEWGKKWQVMPNEC